MSDRPKFPWAEARKIGDQLLDQLAPFCHRIEIAGSIRRQKPKVSDVEFVYIPRTESRPTPGDMFSQSTFDLAEERLFGLINDGVLAMRKNVKGQTTWGDQIKLAVHVKSSIPLDFFPIEGRSWWNYIVCRTGPKESNIAICQAAERRGLQWKPYTAGFLDVKTMEIRPVTSEREVFEMVGLPCLEPKDRS